MTRDQTLEGGAFERGNDPSLQIHEVLVLPPSTSAITGPPFWSILCSRTLIPLFRGFPRICSADCMNSSYRLARRPRSHPRGRRNLKPRSSYRLGSPFGLHTFMCGGLALGSLRGKGGVPDSRAGDGGLAPPFPLPSLPPLPLRRGQGFRSGARRPGSAT